MRGGVTLLAGMESETLSCLCSVLSMCELQQHTYTRARTHRVVRKSVLL